MPGDRQSAQHTFEKSREHVEGLSVVALTPDKTIGVNR